MSELYIIRDAQNEIIQVTCDESAMRQSYDYRDRWLIGVIDTLRSQNSALLARVQELEQRFGIGEEFNRVIEVKSEEMP